MAGYMVMFEMRGSDICITDTFTGQTFEFEQGDSTEDEIEWICNNFDSFDFDR